MIVVHLVLAGVTTRVVTRRVVPSLLANGRHGLLVGCLGNSIGMFVVTMLVSLCRVGVALLGYRLVKVSPVEHLVLNGGRGSGGGDLRVGVVFVRQNLTEGEREREER